MASNSSGKLNPSQTYTLGNYTFRLIINYDSANDITSVQCHASNGESNKQTGKDYIGHYTAIDWHVDAEEKTASVYAHLYKSPIDTTPINKPIPAEATARIEESYRGSFVRASNAVFTSGNGVFTNVRVGNTKRNYEFLAASGTPGSAISFFNDQGEYGEPITLQQSYTRNGKTVYFFWLQCANPIEWTFSLIRPVCNNDVGIPSAIAYFNNIAWCMVYGDDSFDEDSLVTRFVINAQDADAGNWDYPADTGEPSKTLHITVTGALSGRHNDPLNDSSYHYLPSDREQADVYGSGGDGGNGGAGGAGASTVIIYNCATDKAGYTEEIAIAKRHGYGSGAGKGGKGGDGCILVYY